jgi:sulfide:quinone oxidoreductase
VASKILILGGGFGGLAAANTLRGLLPPEHDVLVIDEAPRFTVGAGQTWMALGERRYSEISRSRAALLGEGVRLLEARVVGIDLNARLVATDDDAFSFDHLVIALGADVDADGVPGLDDAHTFYTPEGAERLRPALESFRGGDVVMVVARTPFKCPPAPYEAMLLLHDYFARRSLAKKVRLSIWTVEGQPMATAGPEMGKYIVAELAARGVAFHPQKKASRVDADARRVVFEDGGEAPFDLLITVPPHQAPKAVRDAGLVDASGWIPIDAESLQPKTVTGPAQRDVYAIGDVTAMALPGRFKPDVALSLPKAGVFAEAQGKVVAHRIAAKILARPSVEAFDGEGFCYLELGGGRAARSEASFFALPHPAVRKEEPSEALLRDKRAWVDHHLVPIR